MFSRFPALLGVAAGLAAVGGVAAGPASAHVSVNPSTASKGGYAKLAFRTPNERPTSGTVKIEVVLPADTPIQSVSVRPHPSWKVAVERTALVTPITRADREPVTDVVSKITWTGGTIGPGEFDEFEVSVGPLPKDVDQLVFKAIQTYASGEVVSWIEEAVPGGSEPEHPAPILKLTEASASPAGPAAAPTPVAAISPDSGNEPSQRLAVAALALGAVGLAVGLAALVRRRPTSI